MTQSYNGIYESAFKEGITAENIQEYADWCDGIVVNDDTIVFKDRLGVLRSQKIGGHIIKSHQHLT